MSDQKVPRTESPVARIEVPTELPDQKTGEMAPTGLSGYVAMRRPRFGERFKYIESCGFKVEKDGTVDSAEGSFSTVVRMAEFAEKHIVELAVTVQKDGRVIESIEDLMTSPECDSLIVHLGQLVMQGFGPSKNSKP